MEDLAAKRSANPEIPDKLYFRIGEVAKLAGIKPYVLRFWESEFGTLGPKKSGSGHRLYRRKAVAGKAQAELFSATSTLYQELRRGLRDVLEILNQPRGSRPK
jgi:DNA-binding transcriptional MerR regulator